ncbi:MAG: hypothetical protein H0X34_16245 [Chthoniobacterales bacterium]|nr:hypothetical protein [Chthoniobacterales bacterium]
MRKRLFVFIGVLFAAAVLTALAAPFAVAQGIRAWLAWAAHQEGVTVAVAKIDAPFLGLVTVNGLRITPAREKARAVDLQVARVTLDLNFRGWLFAPRARLLHSVVAEHLRGSVRQGTQRGREKLDWRNLQRLLPDEFRFDDVDLDVTTAATAFAFRGVNLSGSQIEAGKFFAHKIFVTSPLLRQTFVSLRGATSWENDRLTIAGIALARGIDLEALTVDLSSLTTRRIGLEFQLDAFGGSLRASFQGRGGGEKFGVDLAGSAADISLAQISAAAGLLEPLTGSVRASKFTFRGNPGEFLDATASVWIEVSDFAWRARRGDHLVFGATYYNRRLQVEQLYVQQRQNELTVNGELLWPKKRAGWAALQFRGQLNAAIPDANAFAQLFGAKPGDFSGALSARGEIDSLDPPAHGQLSFRGNGVRFRGVSLDSLGGTVQLDGSEATLGSLEIRHANDFFRAHGSANLAAPHAYSGRLTGAINDLADYAPLLPKSWRAAKIGGGITFDWTGDGSAAAHSGTTQFFAHGLRLPVAPLRAPLDVTLEGTYSPQDVFFRTFKLADDRVSLGGFLMLGPNFVELQAFELTLDGTPRASGTLFLPFSVDRWRQSRSLFEALDESQKFDVYLRVDQLDLAEFARALGETTTASGMLDGKLAAFGPLASLQLSTEWHLQNFGPAPTDNSIDFDLRYDSGRANANMAAVFGVSAPLSAHASLPLRLTKRRLGNGTPVDPAKALSFTLDCPTLFLAMLPEKLRPLGASSGLVTGQIGYSNTLRDPRIEGTAQLLDLNITPPPPWPSLTDLTAGFRFGNNAAEIPWLNFDADGLPMRWHGRLTTTPPFFALTLSPASGRIALAALPASGSEISAIRVLGEGIAGISPILQRAVVRGEVGGPDFGLTIETETDQTTLFFDPRASPTAVPLLLNALPPEDTGPALELREARP